MKNRLLFFSALLLAFIGISTCNYQSPTASLAANHLRTIQIHVLDHEDQVNMKGVKVTLTRQGSPTTPEVKYTDENGDTSFTQINTGDKIYFFKAGKEPITIEITQKVPNLSYIGVEMWDQSTGNNTISGRVTMITRVGNPYNGIEVRNSNHPNESDTTENGVYYIAIANQTAPFKIEYLKNPQYPLILTVSRSGGGSATIDVAFDDTPVFGADSLNMPGQNK
ncbi:MAG: hypothetical protein Q7T20_08100 [Saprospiraceae bacterium]|nr:hypothetical protein [Saprospiraceae bacterium]